MSPMEQLALGLQSLGRSARALVRVGPWAPLALLGALELAALAVLTVPAHPALSWALAPLVVRVAGARALHYPDSFRALPGLFAWADGALWWLVGSLALGASSHAFAARFTGRPARAVESLAAAARRWPALVLALLPAHVALAAIGWLAPRFTSGGGLVSMAVAPVFVCARGLVVLLALYLPMLVMLGRRGAPAALAALPRAWSRGLFALLAPCVATLLPLALAGLVLDDPAPIVQRGTPELVAVLVAARVAAGLAIALTLVGAATMAYLVAVEERG